ncbi:MAG TPA: hypothetical protein VKP78_09340 [bacterium]|nr:hypothetical protein [bacterium]
MRKLILFIFIVPIFLSAQVMNTARVLNHSEAAIQVYPSFHGDNPYIYLAGEYGLQNAMDVQVNFGAGKNPYLGANLEKVFIKKDYIISAAGGAHFSNDAGLNLNGNMTYPVASMLDVYGGLDMELNFANSIDTPVWLYLGNAVNYDEKLQFFLEVAVGLDADNIISLGINYNLGSL